MSHSLRPRLSSTPPTTTTNSDSPPPHTLHLRIRLTPRSLPTFSLPLPSLSQIFRNNLYIDFHSKTEENEFSSSSSSSSQQRQQQPQSPELIYTSPSLAAPSTSSASGPQLGLISHFARVDVRRRKKGKRRRQRQAVSLRMRNRGGGGRGAGGGGGVVSDVDGSEMFRATVCVRVFERMNQQQQGQRQQQCLYTPLGYALIHLPGIALSSGGGFCPQSIPSRIRFRVTATPSVAPYADSPSSLTLELEANIGYFVNFGINPVLTPREPFFLSDLRHLVTQPRVSRGLFASSPDAQQVGKAIFFVLQQWLNTSSPTWPPHEIMVTIGDGLRALVMAAMRNRDAVNCAVGQEVFGVVVSVMEEAKKRRNEKKKRTESEAQQREAEAAKLARTAERKRVREEAARKKKEAREAAERQRREAREAAERQQREEEAEAERIRLEAAEAERRRLEREEEERKRLLLEQQKLEARRKQAERESEEEAKRERQLAATRALREAGEPTTPTTTGRRNKPTKKKRLFGWLAGIKKKNPLVKKKNEAPDVRDDVFDDILPPEIGDGLSDSDEEICGSFSSSKILDPKNEI